MQRCNICMQMGNNSSELAELVKQSRIAYQDEWIVYLHDWPETIRSV